MDTIYILHWLQESEDFQVDSFKGIECFKLEDNWIYIQLKKTSPQFEKHKKMNGLVVIEYDPENDTIEIF